MFGHKYFIHVTDAENKESILKKGLCISKSEAHNCYDIDDYKSEAHAERFARYVRENRKPGIWLATPSELDMYKKMLSKDNNVVFKIRSEYLVNKAVGIEATDIRVVPSIKIHLEDNEYNQQEILEAIIKEFGVLVVFEDIPPHELELI